MHPVLFNIGGFEIRAYGVLIALAFFTAIYCAAALAKKKGFKEDDILDIGLVAIVFAVIGARLLYVMVWWEYYMKNPVDIVKVWEGGLVYLGGFIGAFAGGAWWIKRKKLPFLKLADIVVIFLPLGHAIGRIGCFLNGCCYGKTSESCGIVFPAIGDGLPHIPTQLYESAANFLNFIFLISYYRFVRKKPDGEAAFLYFITYGIIRFILEFFRGDPERGRVLCMSTSMFISVIMILTGVSGIIYLRKKHGPARG